MDDLYNIAIEDVELVFHTGSIPTTVSSEQYKEQLTQAIHQLDNCVTVPVTSGVHARNGTLLIDKNSGDYSIQTGGNIEYENRAYAIHGEETFVNKTLQYAFSQHPLQPGEESEAKNTLNLHYHTTILFGINNSRESAAPCGNCRDLMKSYFDLESTLVANVRPDGQVHIFKLGDYYVDTFKECTSLTNEDQLLLDHAFEAYERSFAFYTDVKEGAALRGQKGGIFSGAKMEDVAFHDTMAVLSAIDKAREAKDHIITHAAFVVEDQDHISIPYKERQFLLEATTFNHALGYDEPIKVLITEKEQKKVFETSTEEFMPFAFSTVRFDMGSGLDEYIRELIKEKKP